LSTTPSTTTRVVVLGGGILGVSSAVHLLRRGAQVTLVTEAELASQASGRSLSWLNSAGKRSTPYHDLRMSGIERYRSLFTENADLEWLRFDGGLHWAAQGSAAATAQRSADEQAHGYDSELLSPADIPVKAPGIDPAAVPENAILNRREGWVSLPHLIEHLIGEFNALGGELVLHAGRSSVVTQDGRATGIRTADGRVFDAAAVLVACGAATPDVVAPLGASIPNDSPVSMLVITEPIPGRTDLVLNTPRVALRPNVGGTLALDHDWYEQQITVGADGELTVPDEVVKQLAEEASAVLAGNPPVVPASYKIGYKPIPGDGEPVLGALDEVPNCFVAFTHSGATLGLIVGELLAHEIVTGESAPQLATFRPGRFAG
jgi:glycine/D-amino acid oxidase-like deaminating enzyme